MRKNKAYIFALIFISGQVFCQTDEDVIRYSNTGIGGTGRFIGLSGAMGALGGDMSAASYNPAGLGIMVKSDLNFSFGTHFANTISHFNSQSTKKLSPSLTFNFLGFAGTSASKKNSNNRFTFALGINQLQNFNQQIEIKGRPTRGKSITLDFLEYAKGNPTKNLDPTYEGGAYATYIIDMLDTNNLNSYYSFIDTSKSFLQQKKVNTSGRINEVFFSYAYSFNDDVYIGGTVGIPLLKYTYFSDYAEIDDKNEMYIVKNSNNTYSSSYSYPVLYYSGLGGIKDMHYQSTYTTTATGVNIKIGGIWRITNYLRAGIYYHSPTWYDAKDTYYYSFISNWDEGKSFTITKPDGGGMYQYTITTSSKFGIALSGIVGNVMSINADYEMIDYRKGRLSSKDAGVFDNANKAISKKYDLSGNLRFGIELNTRPVMFRIGWASLGSPFGNQIIGNYVRNIFSIGATIKTKNFYYDVAIVKTYVGKQEYYMYSPKYCDPTNIQLNITQVILSIGLMGQRFDENIDRDKYNNPNNNNRNDDVPNNNDNRNKIPY